MSRVKRHQRLNLISLIPDLMVDVDQIVLMLTVPTELLIYSHINVKLLF